MQGPTLRITTLIHGGRDERRRDAALSAAAAAAGGGTGASPARGGRKAGSPQRKKADGATGGAYSSDLQFLQGLMKENVVRIGPACAAQADQPSVCAWAAKRRPTP